MILLTGASASGKTEVAKTLREEFHIVKAVTCTTRPMRKGEVDGRDYFFLTKEEFLKRKKEGFFVETTYYNGNYYGCGKDQIAPNRVVVVDPTGLKNFQALHIPGIVSFLLTASEKIRIQRMLHRGDKRDNIAQRIVYDRKEFKHVPHTTYVIKTDDLNLEQVAMLVLNLYQKALQKLN